MSNSIKYLVAGVLLVSAFAAYQYFGTASLSVTSIPSEAKVYVDGQLKGVTPIAVSYTHLTLPTICSV